MKRVLSLILLAACGLFGSASGAVELAIKGYDPVAYFTMGRPVRGLPGIEYEHAKSRYRFASNEHRGRFRPDPERYAPQFGNYCAMALTRGELTEAEPEYWLIADGKLYLFGKSVGPDLFRKDLAGNIRRANENRWLIEKR